MISDVVIAGGGLIGMGIAWRCAQRGATVTVVGEAPGTGASFAAAGMLAPVTEASYGEERLLALCRDSLARYPGFVAEVEAGSGTNVGLRTAGTTVVGFDADDMRALEELHDYQRELGLAVERLTVREARCREPGLTPRLRGALHVSGDYSVDARALYAGLFRVAESAGVHVVRSVIEALVVRGGRADGLRLANGDTITGGQVVLALGAESALLEGVPSIPVRPVKGQILRLGEATGLLTGTVRALVRGRRVYLVPYRDRLIVGGTVEDKGFDPTVTAGAVHDLLHDASEMVPGISELRLMETLARWRPGTPDNAPILGCCAVPGLVLATGHYRNGVLLTPVTSDAIADLVTTGQLPEVATPFSLDRFER